MSWQGKASEVAIQNIINELATIRDIHYVNPISQNIGGVGSSVGGLGIPSGGFGFRSGTQVDIPILTPITDKYLDANGVIQTGSMDRIDVKGVFLIIKHTSPTNIDLKWIQKAIANGQRIKITPETGKTLTLKVAGNIDIGTDVVIGDNQAVEMIFTTNSNVTAQGGWVILGVSGGGGSSFPILYPEDNIGNVGNQTVTVSLAGATAHYHEMTLIGNIGLAFNNPPAADKGLPFYIMFIQDATGNRTITSVPAALKNGSQLNTLLDKAANAKTLFKFFTGDGGVSYHAIKIDLSSTGGSSSLATLSDVTITGLANRDILQYDSTPSRWVNKQFFVTGNPVADAGFIRGHNNGIILGIRNNANDGQYEVKVDASDFLDITYTKQAPIKFQLRSQHDTQPDQVFQITQGSGTGASTLMFAPTTLTIDIGAFANRLSLNFNELDSFVNIDLNNQSLLKVSGIGINSTGGVARGSITGGATTDDGVTIAVQSGNDFNLVEGTSERLRYDVSTAIFRISNLIPGFAVKDTGSLKEFILFRFSDRTEISDPDKIQIDINSVEKLRLTGTEFDSFVNIDLNNQSLLKVSGMGVVSPTGSSRGSIYGGSGTDTALYISGNTGASVVIQEFLTNRLIVDFTTNTLEFRDATPIFSLVETAGSTQFAILKFNGSTEINEPTSIKFQINASDKITLTNASTVISNTLQVTGTSQFLGTITVIGDASTDTLTVNAQLNSHLIPLNNEVHTLGDSTHVWLSSHIQALNFSSSSNFFIKRNTSTNDMEFDLPLSSDQYLFSGGGTNVFAIEGDGTLQWKQSGRLHKIDVTSTALQIYSENSGDTVEIWNGVSAVRPQIISTQAVITLQHGGSGTSNPIDLLLAQPTPAAGTVIGNIRWGDDSLSPLYAQISVTPNAVTGGSEDGEMKFSVVQSGVLATILEMESTSAGVLQIGFFGSAPVAKPNVTGSRGGNAALASFLTAIANLGLITDSTT